MSRDVIGGNCGNCGTPIRRCHVTWVQPHRIHSLPDHTFGSTSEAECVFDTTPGIGRRPGVLVWNVGDRLTCSVHNDLRYHIAMKSCNYIPIQRLLTSITYSFDTPPQCRCSSVVRQSAMVSIHAVPSESIRRHVRHLNIALHAGYTSISAQILFLGLEEAGVMDLESYDDISMLPKFQRDKETYRSGKATSHSNPPS